MLSRIGKLRSKLAPQKPGHLMAVDIGHADVEENQVGPKGARRIHHFLRIGFEFALMAHHEEQFEEAPRGILVVVDDENTEGRGDMRTP